MEQSNIPILSGLAMGNTQCRVLLFCPLPFNFFFAFGCGAAKVGRDNRDFRRKGIDLSAKGLRKGWLRKD